MKKFLIFDTYSKTGYRIDNYFKPLEAINDHFDSFGIGITKQELCFYSNKGLSETKIIFNEFLKKQDMTKKEFISKWKDGEYTIYYWYVPKGL